MSMLKRRKYITRTPERNIMLFRHYMEILKRNREKYGDVARSIFPSTIYEEAGFPFGIGAQQSGRIIRMMLRTMIDEHPITLQEYDETLHELEAMSLTKAERAAMALERVLKVVGVQKTKEEIEELTQEYLLKNV